MGHTWVRNVIGEERVAIDEDGNERLIPEVLYFPKCEKCGCLITLAKNEPIYRATPSSQWLPEEPECR